MQIAPFTRRRFLSNLALSTTASSRLVRAATSLNPTHLAFFGIAMPGRPEQDRIEVYRINESALQLSASTAAATPRAIVLHPTLPVLYVANCVAEHQHRPRGIISAFRIDIATASLSLLSHEPLTLGATLPSHIAIAPNGMHLAIASAPTGIFNLFSLRKDGTILPTPSPLKLSGLSSALHEIAFHPASSALFAKFPSHEERLDIQSDSSLVRGIPTQSYAEHAITRADASILNAALKQQLDALHVASLALLTL